MSSPATPAASASAAASAISAGTLRTHSRAVAAGSTMMPTAISVPSA